MATIRNARNVTSGNARAARAVKVDTIKAAALAATPAPVKVEAPAAPAAPVKVDTLANASADAQTSEIVAALAAPALPIVAAALNVTSGNFDLAAQYLAAPALPVLQMVRRIVPILRSAAPAALFTSRNNHGARVGELFAARLGLGKVYRDASRVDLKAARADLIESAK